MELSKRKKPRLDGYQYTRSGYYFVTVCTAVRYENILCSIRSGPSESDPVTVSLTPAGETVLRYIQGINRISPEQVYVDDYVIMPDHIHLLLHFRRVDAPGRSVSLSKVINSLKGLSTKEIGYSIWQRNYYDHVVLDAADLQAFRDYINHNPENWYFKD